MKFRRFLSSLLVTAAALGLIGYAGYSIYCNLTDSKTQEIYDREVNFVAQEVSPYTEDEEARNRFYYYKCNGGEQYFPARFWNDRSAAEIGPVSIQMENNGLNTDITQQVIYDTTAQTLILPEEFMLQLSVGEYFIRPFNEAGEELDCLHLVVQEEVTFNAPAGHAYLECAVNRNLYYSKAEHNEISLYFYNIGDNYIVDVFKFFDESENGLLHPDDYVISEAGNKVTLTDKYLSSLRPYTKLSLGVRFADGTILKPDYRYIWTMEEQWNGLVFTDLADYSLSSGQDFVVHFKRGDSEKLHTIFLGGQSGEEYKEYLNLEPIDWGGAYEYVDKTSCTMTIPAEYMATLPTGEYMLGYYYYFDYQNNVYCSEQFPFHIVP